MTLKSIAGRNSGAVIGDLASEVSDAKSSVSSTSETNLFQFHTGK
ncbi:hypothetical protein [Phaeobacter sp. C3_T13_0]